MNCILSVSYTVMISSSFDKEIYVPKFYSIIHEYNWFETSGFFANLKTIDDIYFDKKKFEIHPNL